MSGMERLLLAAQVAGVVFVSLVALASSSWKPLLVAVPLALSVGASVAYVKWEERKGRRSR